MNNRRVVVTGLGVISSTGLGVNDFWDAVLHGRSGVSLVEGFDCSSFRTKIAAEIKNPNYKNYGFTDKDVARNSKPSLYAMIASDEAIEQSGIIGNVPAEKISCIIGSGIGGMRCVEEQTIVLKERSARRVDPLLIPNMIINLVGGGVSMRHNLRGPSYSPVSACATGIHSIGEAYWNIVRGESDAAVCGGSESAITPLGIAGFSAIKAMSAKNDTPKTASTPFTLDRDGFVMAEGAGILVLEELETARKRGANILVEFVGYGSSSDAYHITAPRPDGSGCVQAINTAMNFANLNPQDIDYVNAHGTSTQLNDKTETLALKKYFGDYAYKMAVSSTKSTTGHGLGAAGAWESILSILAIQNNIVPPTSNYQNPDPECDLDYVPNIAREQQVSAVLNTNLGFGGHNAVNIFKKFKL